MKLTEHFTLEELTRSDYANEHGLSNTANEYVEKNLMMLCVLILEPLRMTLNRAVIINSGYRSKDVNAGVGGVPSSHHLLGLAADIHFHSETELKEMLSVLKRNKHLDLALVERSKNAKWLHVQLPRPNATPRHRISSVYVSN